MTNEKQKGINQRSECLTQAAAAEETAFKVRTQYYLPEVRNSECRTSCKKATLQNHFILLQFKRGYGMQDGTKGYINVSEQQMIISDFIHI